MKKNQELPSYNDQYFRIIAAVLGAYLATEFGGIDPLFERLLSKWFYIEFGSSLVIALIVVETIAFFTRWLDKRYDWIQHTVTRIGLQLVLCVLLPAITDFFLAALYFGFFGVHIWEDTFYLVYAFPYIILMILLFNLYYLAHYFFIRFRELKSKPDDHPTDNEKQQFIINSGSRHVKVEVGEIAYVLHEGEFNYLYLFTGKKHLIPETLEALEEQLPTRTFFRANRQIIVNHKACKYFKKARFGKLELFLDSIIPDEPIIISQRRATEFKKWFGDGKS
ncbi:LytR/AlgR family response regulator transcription factor [Negadavirga shengliensis]|uniref:LytR/AlgR family response regulator transcription factor n=1 Tax=Negadavirga shengliensis TaxID=1389218 RepID=A0ABV9T0V7_9BACT